MKFDIFRKSKQNGNIKDKRDAWLTLFADDTPEKIIELVETYPGFRAVYEEGYEICRNIEGVMEMFSKELYELDRNTVQYMIDEMQEEIDAQKGTIDAQKGTINKQQQTIEKMQKEHAKTLSGTIAILRDLSLPEQEIITRICEQYQINAEQVRKYL